MELSRPGYLVLGLIFICYLLVTLVTLTEWTGQLPFLLRITGLYGYLSLAIAAMLTPFLTEIRATFGKPFLAVHHFFAAFGLVAITIHPLVNAFLAMNIAVFIPKFGSWGQFWALAGRPAFFLIYIALAGVLIRRVLKRSWRPVHALMYIALLFGFVHGFLIGTDFAHPLIQGLYTVLIIGVIGTFLAKRLKLRIRGQPPTPL